MYRHHVAIVHAKRIADDFKTLDIIIPILNKDIVKTFDKLNGTTWIKEQKSNKNRKIQYTYWPEDLHGWCCINSSTDIAQIQQYRKIIN